MEISEVNIDLIKPQNGLIGFASLVIDGDVYLSSIGIHKKLDGTGYRLTYPSKGNHSIFYPINKQSGMIIEQEIIKKLNDVMNKVTYPCQKNTTQI
jgi:stage V sporulation protein G